MKKIETFINQRSGIFVTFGFLLINFWFNGTLFWSQLFFDSSTNGAIWGEVRVYEWLTNKFYESLLSGKNPFGLIDGMLYPFQIQVGLTDAGNGLFYFLFRPFLSSFQSFSIIMALSQFLANIGMYLLLRKLQISKSISFVIALAFGYMTFLAVRQGHLNYFMIYVFPWFYLSILQIFSSKNKNVRIISSFAAALFFVLALWVNFYYFIMIVISIFSFAVYFLLFKRPQVVMRFRQHIVDILRTLFLAGILLIPWFKGVYEAIKFENIAKLSGWGGAIEFSADLFSLFIPSVYNHYIYNYFSEAYERLVKTYALFALGAFENFVYPGLIILVGLALYMILQLKKDFRDKIKPAHPFFFASLIFFVLTLGPFLHVFGKWGYWLDQNIRLVVPLPYVFFHYIPLLENIRVPGRIVVAFIFFAYIVSAFVLDYIIAKKTIWTKTVFLILLLSIFVVDQRYVSYVTPPDIDYPYNIYKNIELDKTGVSVMEIPFVVRDGFTYFGDDEAVFGIVGESFHKHPIIGGYTGRIADYKRAYYYRNPLLGYLGRAIDVNVTNNPVVDKKELKNWKQIDTKAATEVIDFLDIKYVIVDNKENYAPPVTQTLMQLGYKKIMSDGVFDLLARLISKKEFLKVDFDSSTSVTYLGMGWQPREGRFRLSESKSSVMLKILKKRNMNLRFIIHVKKNQLVTIYINKKLVGKVLVTVDKSSYTIEIGNVLEPGVNTIHFFFETTGQDNLTAADFESVELMEK